jgi:hypothetical protein
MVLLLMPLLALISETYSRPANPDVAGNWPKGAFSLCKLHHSRTHRPSLSLGVDSIGSLALCKAKKYYEWIGTQCQGYSLDCSTLLFPANWTFNGPAVWGGRIVANWTGVDSGVPPSFSDFFFSDFDDPNILYGQVEVSNAGQRVFSFDNTPNNGLVTALSLLYFTPPPFCNDSSITNVPAGKVSGRTLRWRGRLHALWLSMWHL